MILFPNGIQGLADTMWSGVRGAAHRLVGIDYRSEPGTIKAHQKLSKISASVIDEFCKVALPLSDGSTLWFSNESGKIWREVSDTFSLLGTLTIPGYDFKLTNTSYSGKSFNYSTQVNIPTGHFFSADGTKMYVICNAKVSGNSGEIFQYTLSTAFDISTASYASKTFVADVNSIGLFIKPDGTKLYVIEDGGSNTVIEYDLSTAWDISTASASGDTYDFSAQFARGYSIWFKPDGTEMYLGDGTNHQARRYTLSTPWDITTATYTSGFNPTSDSEIDSFSLFYGGVFLNPEGTVMIMTSSSGINDENIDVAKFELTTAWDITTAVYRNGYNLSSGINFATYFFENADGDQSFIVGSQSGPETVYQYDLGFQSSVPADTAVTVLGASEYGVADGPDDADEDTDLEVLQYVYFATENWLIRVVVSDVTDITNLNENNYIAQFLNGDDTYHPMRVANNRLFIGDKYCIAQVNEAGVVTLETNLTVREPERITIIENFDVDLLVGTKRLDERSRVLRWDTESQTWYGEDVIYEGEIHAFLDEDNYTYAIVGDFGQMHYYDGEKLLKYMRIPGSYGSTAKIKVNANAVGYFMGVPIFGVSNVSGNPALQGVYSFGQYSKDYNVTMDLSFPISSGEFSGIEIGAILVQGSDMYLSWKSSTGVGVDKLDWTTKYYGGYIETMVLNGAEDRSKLKSLDNVLADYIEMPDSTAVVMQYSKNYGSYETLEQVPDDILYQLRAKATVPDIGAITLKFTFNTNSNDTPKIENFHANFEGEDQNDS